MNAKIPASGKTLLAAALLSLCSAQVAADPAAIKKSLAQILPGHRGLVDAVDLVLGQYLRQALFDGGRVRRDLGGAEG